MWKSRFAGLRAILFSKTLTSHFLSNLELEPMSAHFTLHRWEVHLVQEQVRTDYSFLFCQSMKGRPPPAPLFGDDDDDDIDWLG